MQKYVNKIFFAKDFYISNQIRSSHHGSYKAMSIATSKEIGENFINIKNDI
jgi:hypothetical protein